MKLPLTFAVAAMLLTTACSTGASSNIGTPTPSVTREAAAACPEVTGSHTTTFIVTSKSKRSWTLRASDIDCFDWSGVDTPAKLDGVVLEPGTEKVQRIEARAPCPGSGWPIPIPDRTGRFTLTFERTDGSGLTAKVPVKYQCEDFKSPLLTGTYCDELVANEQAILTDIVDASGTKKGLLTGSLACGTERGKITFRDIP